MLVTCKSLLKFFYLEIHVRIKVFQSFKPKTTRNITTTVVSVKQVIRAGDQAHSYFVEFAAAIAANIYLLTQDYLKSFGITL